MNRNISLNQKVFHLSPDVAAGTDGSRQTLAEIDCKDFEAVVLVANLGTVTATGVITLRAKGSDTSGSYGSGTVGDLGSVATAASAGSNKAAVLEVIRPQNRYLRFDYQRTTANVVINSIVAIGLKRFEVEDSELAVREFLNAPTPSLT